MLTQIAETKSKYDVHHEGTKDTKVQEYYFFISYFALFVSSFVVRCLLRFWLRLRRAGLFATSFVVKIQVRSLRLDSPWPSHVC